MHTPAASRAAQGSAVTVTARCAALSLVLLVLATLVQSTSAQGTFAPCSDPAVCDGNENVHEGQTQPSCCAEINRQQVCCPGRTNWIDSNTAKCYEFAQCG